MLYRLLSSLDLIKEEAEDRLRGPGPARVPTYSPEELAAMGMELEPEYERFSPDRDWMPRLVLIAKNTYVWLDQLSKKYQRAITRLDQIPDEELDTLARWGFTGLWLIGLWERSQASQRIKQIMRQPRGRRLGLLAVRLPHRRRPGRRGGLPEPARAAPGSAASAWPATWCPTTWASTRGG